MKKLLLFPLLGLCSYTSHHKLPPPKIKPVKIIKPKPVETSVVEGMILVESSGNDSAFNASENAAGCLQIRPIMVREVNRILRKQGDTLRYNLNDRWSRDKSLEMFHIWREYHHPNSTDEVIARNWNGGPRGYEKESTIRYWKKVRGHIDVIK